MKLLIMFVGVLTLILLSISSTQCHQQLSYQDVLRTANKKILQANASRHAPAQQPLNADIVKDMFSVNNVFQQFLLGSKDNEDAPLLSADQVLDLTDEETVSRCENDTQLMIANILERQQWALQMLDAFGKPNSGILRGDFLWLGDFDECIKVFAWNQTEYAGGFEGKYCTGTLAPPGTVKTPTLGAAPTGTATIGLCVPDSCNASEILNAVNKILDNFNATKGKIEMIAAQCQEKSLELDSKAVVAICVCSLFLLLVFMGTSYDVYLKNYKDNFPLKLPVFGSKSKYGSTNKSKHDENTSLLESSTESVSEATDQDIHVETKKQVAQYQTGMLASMLLSFSVYTNGAKLLNTDQSKDSLQAVHGIRFLSMSWVILGHSFAFVLSMSDNLPFLQDLIKRNSFSAILNATVSVDTFFTLSGLLVAYIVIAEMKKSNGKINWFMFYFHRFWRLTPVYMLLIMIDVCLFRYIGDGPIWPQQGVEIGNCNETWWTNLLYINNLYKSDEMCFGWSWYLANDMQFYILSPLLLIPLYMSKLWGSIVISVFLFATWLTTGLISKINHIPTGFMYKTEGANPGDTAAFMQDLYFKPYCRMGPYLVGIVAGYILCVTNKKIKMGKLTVLVGWCVATVCATLVLYGLYDYANGSVLDNNTSAFYNATNRTVWGACVAWVIVACATGYGGFINTILSWKGFVPLSRLTYCAYLIHPLVIFGINFSFRKAFYLYDFHLIYYFFGHMVMSYGIAFIVSLLFEAPMMGLEKAIFKRGKK